jgi:hypothetical protein
MDGSYEIGVQGEGGFVPLARVHFDGAHTGVLTLGAPHAESRRLIGVWKDLTARSALSVKSTRERIEADGSEVHEIFSEDVPRGDPGHPDALLRTLYRDHGFAVREAT